MYNAKKDSYVCDICGVEEVRDENGFCKNELWECDYCFSHFCTECFAKKHGYEALGMMLCETDYMLCPDCYAKRVFSGDSSEDA